MARATRSRLLAVDAGELWRTVGNVEQLPRWWPRVVRIEAVEGVEFTQVLKTDKGREVRADFTIVEQVSERLLRYEQQVDGTPFEGLLKGSATEVGLLPQDGGTVVAIVVERELKGLARFGGVIVRRGTRRQIDEALDALARIFGASAGDDG